MTHKPERPTASHEQRWVSSRPVFGELDDSALEELLVSTPRRRSAADGGAGANAGGGGGTSGGAGGSQPLEAEQVGFGGTVGGVCVGKTSRVAWVLRRGAGHAPGFDAFRAWGPTRPPQPHRRRAEAPNADRATPQHISCCTAARQVRALAGLYHRMRAAVESEVATAKAIFQRPELVGGAARGGDSLFLIAHRFATRNASAHACA